jgi:Kef-type K+ transport system membrane component KefB
MTAIGTFLAFALCILVVPYAIWATLGLRSVFPLVAVQFLCGVLAGPTVLGRLAPGLWQDLFASGPVPALSGLGWLAIVLFAFLIGVRIDQDEVRRSGRSLLALACSCFVAPLVLGGGAALWLATLYPEATEGVASRWHLAAAFGICASITALPVLGALIREVGLLDTEIGRTALTCAALNDGILWIVLALLLMTRQLDAVDVQALSILVSALAYVAAMLLAVRPLLARWLTDALSPEVSLLAVLGVAVASALASEIVGLHYVFGALLAGLIVPARLKPRLAEQLEPVVIVLLLPFFFTVTGFKMDLTVSSTWLAALFLAAAFVAETSKLCGVAVVARLSGRSREEAATLAVLLLTKGAVDLVVLSILLEAGILPGSALTAMLLLMLGLTASVKTALRIVRRGAPGVGEPAAAQPRWPSRA